MKKFDITRRGLLRFGAGTASLSLLSNLTFMQRSASAAAPAGTYKSLVCVYLYGGNDSFNLIVPTSTAEYTTYATSRQGLAVPKAQLLPITPATATGVNYGLHPSVPELESLFAANKLALLANVGSLVAPISKAQFQNGSVDAPPQLFSHADQTDQWMMGASVDAIQKIGWCGKVGENLVALNNGHPMSMNISLDGSNVLQTGQNSVPYDLGTSGPTALDGFWGQQGATRKQAFDALRTATYTNKLQKSFAATMNTAISLQALLSSSLASAPTLGTTFPNSWLGSQLAMVAKMISVKDLVGQNRQIFMVGKGGFDTHGDQNQDQPGLYADISQCVAAFQAAMEEIGVAADVTLFTASEFGRTLSSNGKGTDHGWGSHHFALGGAVVGGDIYGAMPDLTLDGPDDIGGGRLIPTTALDQYAATLATWFGVSGSDLPTMFPNLGHFGSPTLAFL